MGYLGLLNYSEKLKRNDVLPFCETYQEHVPDLKR